MSADVYWHWINDRRDEVDETNHPSSFNVTRTVHAALDCLGRNDAIAEAIFRINLPAGYFARDMHYFCEGLAE